MRVSVRNRLSSTSALSRTLAGVACLAVLPLASAEAAERARATMPTVTVEAGREEWLSQGYKPTRASSPKYTAPLVDVPQTVNVVPAQVIEDRGATTLRDVVKNVTGITAAAGEGGAPNGDNLTIRGFDARTDIFLDGVRDIGGYFRDAFNLEQVEVVKGPSSAYAGRGSTGGTVNQVSKTPHMENFARAAATVGNDNLRRMTTDINHKIAGLEGAAFRINAMAHGQNVASRDEVEYNRWGVAPSLTFGQGADTRLTLSYLHQQEDNLPDYGHPYFGGGTIVSGEGTPTGAAPVAKPVNVRYENFYGLVSRDYEDTGVDMGTAVVEHDFDDSLSLRNATRFGRTTKDTIVTPPRSPNFTNNTLTRNGRDKDSEDTIFVNQTDLTARFTTGGLSHTLVTGVEFGWEDFKNRDRNISNMTGASLLTPNPFEAFTGTITPGNTTKTDANSQAVYAFDTVRLNRQWEVNGGLRWDRFDAETRVSNGDFFARTDTHLSGRAGVVYKPRENGSIYAAYGTSFNPSAEALALNSDTNTLEPEKSRTYELGTKWDLMGDRLGVTAAIFRTEKTNARTEDSITEIVTLDGEQHVDGLELGITGKITDAWQVFAGYTYLTSEVDSSRDPAEVGKEVNRTPEHTFSLWSTYAVTPKFEIGGGAQYVDERYSNNSNTNLVPDYLLFDAMAAYQATDRVMIRLNLINLADEKYYDAVGGGHAVPGAGRTFLLTTAVDF